MNHYKIRLFMPILTVLALGACSNQVQDIPAAGSNKPQSGASNQVRNAAANSGKGGKTQGVNYGAGGGVSSTGAGRQYNNGGRNGQDYYRGGAGSGVNGGTYRETYQSADLKNPQSLLFERIIYFDYDQTTIKPHYKKVLAAHAEMLKRNPAISMYLEGHADERGTREYNVALSEQRAKSVEWYLRGKGISGARTEAVAYGEERPLVVGDGEKSWAKNRRVELKYPGR